MNDQNRDLYRQKGKWWKLGACLNRQVCGWFLLWDVFARKQTFWWHWINQYINATVFCSNWANFELFLMTWHYFENFSCQLSFSNCSWVSLIGSGHVWLFMKVRIQFELNLGAPLSKQPARDAHSTCFAASKAALRQRVQKMAVCTWWLLQTVTALWPSQNAPFLNSISNRLPSLSK